MGETATIFLDRERPERFNTKDDERLWERIMGMDAMDNEDKVERGAYLPPEICRKLQQKIELTPQEARVFKEARDIAREKETVGSLL